MTSLLRQFLWRYTSALQPYDYPINTISRRYSSIFCRGVVCQQTGQQDNDDIKTPTQCLCLFGLHFGRDFSISIILIITHNFHYSRLRYSTRLPASVKMNLQQLNNKNIDVSVTILFHNSHKPAQLIYQRTVLIKIKSKSSSLTYKFNCNNQNVKSKELFSTWI